MVKIKDFRIETLEEVLKQNELLEENEQYTFRIKEIFLNGYCLEVYIPKKDKLHTLLDGYYEVANNNNLNAMLTHQSTGLCSEFEN